MTESVYETPLRALLQDRLSSPSHSFEHLDRVLAYAHTLQATYGGDSDVLSAAALLHDLGRSDTTLKGADSAVRSVEIARGLLADVAFPADKVEPTLQAIGEHDQPELRPATLEGRILKDADFLAGFGATGIARVALWTGESDGTMADLEHRLGVKMAARIASLEFEQSRATAARDYVFVRLFLERLHAAPTMEAVPAQPYVVIEGISGSGKSTQSELLAKRFSADGVQSARLREPTPWYRQMKNSLSSDQRDRTAQLLLLLTDRYLNLRPEILAAQAAGKAVISDRSYLSSMVYQASDGWLSAENIAYLHTLVPQPTHLFLLDLPADDAITRIEYRLNTTREARGDHETLEQLRVHRDKFLALRSFFPRMVGVDANQPPDALHEQIWSAIAG